MQRSRRMVALVVLLMLLLSSQVAIANSGGKYNSPSGCNCHGGSAASPTPSHNFPSTYSPGQIYSLSIGMNGGVSGSEGGFNLQVSSGTLSTGVGIMNTQVNSAGNQATHQFPDYRSWSLEWTAPSSGSGTVTFSLAVLAANGNGANSEHFNPFGRSIGEFPTTKTCDELVDAYLWIKVPGESDGRVNGGPKAGRFSHHLALDLIHNKK